MNAFTRYVRAKIEQDHEELAYRVYVSDGMWAEYGVHTCRYYDIISNKEPAEPEKSEEEIILETMQGGGLHFKREE